MKALSFSQKTVAGSALLSAIGVALGFWPIAAAPITPFQATGRADEIAAIPLDSLSSERLFRSLDLSTLPPPPPPVTPPPDPAARLKSHRYLGGAAAEGRARALFSIDGAIIAISPGQAIDGYSLTSFDRHQAIFDKEGVEVAIPLTGG